MKRTFVATPVNLNDDFQKLYTRLQHYTQYDKINWVKPELQHITLKFIGDTPNAMITPLADKLSDILSQFDSFDLEINKLGFFGPRNSPEIIWVGFQDFEPMKEIFAKVEEEIVGMGLRKNDGHFVSHITLGYIKKIADKTIFWKYFEQLQQLTFSQKIHIDSFTLFRSQLEHDGPIYTPIRKCMLK
ncbi:MAG: RNA 2',3'-cyclic phosphodiesterase [Bacteroidales bacterium]|nr:RNA 2',3'-cyclic phosphodiesterase [Bacteroidales bacterium]